MKKQAIKVGSKSYEEIKATVKPNIAVKERIERYELQQQSIQTTKEFLRKQVGTDSLSFVPKVKDRVISKMNTFFSRKSETSTNKIHQSIFRTLTL